MVKVVNSKQWEITDQWRRKQQQVRGRGANPGALGDGSPPEAESFSKNMYKIWSNLTKNFKNLALL